MSQSAVTAARITVSCCRAVCACLQVVDALRYTVQLVLHFLLQTLQSTLHLTYNRAGGTVALVASSCDESSEAVHCRVVLISVCRPLSVCLSICRLFRNSWLSVRKSVSSASITCPNSANSSRIAPTNSAQHTTSAKGRMSEPRNGRT